MILSPMQKVFHCVTITGMRRLHEPVLVREFLELASPSHGEVWVDATAGFGGHTFEIARAVGEDGVVVAIEKDPVTYEILVNNIAEMGLKNVVSINSDYIKLSEIVISRVGRRPNGVLFDLGISSFHIDEAGRGFSYRKDEYLDMRFDPSRGQPLADALKSLSEEDIASIIYAFGEERRARRIASAIYRAVRRGELTRTAELNSAIRSVVPARILNDVLPRVYQAFRIFINEELEHVAIGLASAAASLEDGGRLVIISYHSLEDRIAKQLGKLPIFERVNKRVVRPSETERKRNPRSRSAKMRVLLKVGDMDEKDIYNHIAAFVPRFRRRS